MKAIILGLDIAKQVFQVHGVDASGAVVLRRRLRRRDVVAYFARLEPAVVGMETCATAHFWARGLRACGHDVRLMPAQCVKAYVRRNKHDAADAEACCEAVQRPGMRFVPVKSEAAQAALMKHRVRETLMRQRTMLVNALRGHLAEIGMVAPKGREGAAQLCALVEEESDESLPAEARTALRPLVTLLTVLGERIASLGREIETAHRRDPRSRLLATIPGIGPIIADTLVSSVPDPGAFRSGRDFAAWIGLTPRQNSTGGKQRPGRITKRGDTYLRRLLVNGAHAVVQKARPGKTSPWLLSLLERRPPMLCAVALANKMARTALAVMRTGQPYRSRPATA
jgi:transposase